MSDNIKISLAFAVSLLVLVLAAGRWQGSVDTKITILFEKVLASQGDLRDAKNDIKGLEGRLNGHLEDCHAHQ